MAFPSSPDNGEQYTIDNVTWEYVSFKGAWELIDWQNLKGVTVQAFTSSGTWTKPANADMVSVVCVGAGGGGDTAWVYTIGAGGEEYYGGGNGGGGGAMSHYTYDASDLGSTVTVTVGTGGTGGTDIFSNTGNAVNGGFSSFGSGVEANGGLGANRVASSGGYPGAGGAGMFTGGSGGGSLSNYRPGSYIPYASSSGSSGSNSYGGAGGGGGGGLGAFGSGNFGGNGGSAASHSINNPDSSPTGMAVPASGGDGGSPNTAFTPIAGNAYGGGGGGGALDTSTPFFFYGASGASGIVVVITWYSA
jgi:hypothetical protein